MNHLIHFLRQLELGDPCSLTLLALLLIFIGGKIVADKPHLYLWGLRLAVAGFVGFTAYQLLRYPFPQAEELLGFALRSLLAAGLILGVAWIILPLAGFIYAHTLGAGWQHFRSWAMSVQSQANQRQAWREQEHRRQREQQDYECLAPERDRAEREAEARQQAEAQAQHRRDMARANCELLFDLLAPEIGKRFTRKMFEAFLEKHLADKHPPEYVEHWAQQLQAMLRQHAQKVQATPRFQSLEEIARWFQQEQQKIENQPIDDKAKRTLLAKLRAKFQELNDQFLEDLA